MASIVDSLRLRVYDATALSCDSFPVVDFSALSAADPDQRSKAINDISKACEEWGFFILVNHGVPENLMNATFAAVEGFFNLGVDEKKQYAAKTFLDPLKYVGFDMCDVAIQTFNFWDEKLTVRVHPKLHCPSKPESLRGVVAEYGERTRNVCRVLMGAVSDALQLEQHYVDRVLGLDSTCQSFVSHKYPPCPHPDQAIGLTPHTDPGLFTLLIHNGVPGLQIEHHGQWFHDGCPKNTVLVNVTDQLESFSNGRYKSIKHRVVVNKERERISIASFYAPSQDVVISPATPLVEKDGGAMYKSVMYEDFVESSQLKITSFQ
ncbi:hypothetical protein ACS0TY_026584 [Phlomoides rotata]